MKHNARSDGLAALLSALIAAQWFSTASSGLIPAAGNAAYLAILLAGGVLCAISALLPRLLPQQGLLEMCRQSPALSFLPLLCTALLTLLAASALRDTLSMLRLTLLPDTPRWFMLVLVLGTLLFMAKGGPLPVMRTVRLLAPFLIALYAAVLTLSLWGQMNVYNLFPLLGAGGRGIGKAAVSALSAGIWLVLLCIEPAQGKRCGIRAAVWGTGLAAAGYLFYALLFGDASAQSDFPLHRMSLTGGLSYAFERAQALFVFVWLPIQLAASAAGLAYAVQCIRSRLPKAKPLPSLLALGALTALLALPDPERSPAWLRALLQSNVQCLMLIPLLLALIVSGLRNKKEGKNHA